MDRGIDTRSPIAKKSMQPRLGFFFRVYVWSFFIFCGASVFIVATHAPITKITRVNVFTGASVPAELIENYVHARLIDSRFTLVSRTSYISVPLRSLERDIQIQFPFIANVHASVKTPHTIDINITEYPPMYIYCDASACVGIRDTGEILAPIQGKSEKIVFQGNIQTFSQSGLSDTYTPPSYGKKIIDTVAWQRVRATIAILEKNSISVERVQLLPLGFFTINARTKEDIKSSFEIRMRSDAQMYSRLEELGLAFENGLRERMNRERLEYIISYVSEKVIYKFNTLPKQ